MSGKDIRISAKSRGERHRAKNESGEVIAKEREIISYISI